MVMDGSTQMQKNKVKGGTPQVSTPKGKKGTLQVPQVKKGKPTPNKGFEGTHTISSKIREDGNLEDREEHDKCTLFMRFPSNYLHSDKQIRQMCTNVKSVRFPGATFVEFHSEEDAEECYNSLQSKDLGNGQKLQVDYVGKKARQKRTDLFADRPKEFKRLHVKGFPKTLVTDDLQKLFPASTDAFIPMRQKSKLRFGFVSFGNEKDANAALESTVKCEGHILTLSFALKPGSKRTPPSETDALATPAKKAKIEKPPAQQEKEVVEENDNDDEENEEEDDSGEEDEEGAIEGSEEEDEDDDDEDDEEEDE